MKRTSWLESSDTVSLRILTSLAEAFLPAIPEAARQARAQGNERLARYYEFPGPCGHSPRIAFEAVALCDAHLPSDKISAVKWVLWLLSTGFGTLVLGGWHAVTSWKPPFAKPFDLLNVKQRESVLLAWRDSYIPVLRQAFKAIQGLVMYTLFASHDADGHNPLWPLIGYPGKDPHKPAQPSADKLKSEAWLLRAICDFGDHVQLSPSSVLETLKKHGLAASKGASTECAAEVMCDAIVVGSGAGGGTAAGVLAAAGLKVVVVEKGRYIKAADLTTLEKDAYDSMYERGGLLMATEDGGVAIMAGSTVGGGTRVNWSVSLRTPEHVRKEWADVHGLPNFTSDRFSKALDAVCARQGVTTGVRHNRANALLRDALCSLSADVEEMPRNCRDSEHCGHCPHGCPYGNKQDTTATFLADAAKAGAKILTGCFADHVLTEDTGSGCKRAIGIKLHPAGRSDIAVNVLAPVVVASAGTLHNPVLLLRSGITCRGNVGKHLHLHCAAVVAARFPVKDDQREPNEGRINSWEGPVMSAYSRQVADWSGTGYGPLVSMTSAHPGLMSAGSRWDGARAFRETSATFPWLALSCIYIRDKDSGKVTLGADGMPRVHYWPSHHDQMSILKGLEFGARAMVQAGASTIFTSQPLPKSELDIRRGSDGSMQDPQQLEKFVQGIHSQGIKAGEMALFSLHQMGSCRMGSLPTNSVANGEGECWDCPGLYIADASAFPTASGVNPMITAEALAYMVADGIAHRCGAAEVQLPATAK